MGRAWSEEAMVTDAYCSLSCLLALSPWVGLPGMHLTWLSGLQSVYERQGIAVMTPTVPGSPKGPFLGLPRGTMRRQKSIGKKRDPHPKTWPLSFQMQPSAPQEAWASESWPHGCLGTQTLTTPHWACLPGAQPLSYQAGSPLIMVGYKNLPLG